MEEQRHKYLSCEMITSRNKYELNDLVFVMAKGMIIHCKVTRILLDYNSEGISYTYYLNSVDPEYNDILDLWYSEEGLCSRIEDIVNILEVH